MPTKRKLRLPNLPFRPLVMKRIGDQRLMMDLPVEDRRQELRNSRLNNRYGGIVTITDLAELFGTDTHSIARWFKIGVRWNMGEDLCDRIGLHPAEVWPDYYGLLADAEYEFAIGMKEDDLVDDRIMEKIGGSNGSRA